MAVYEQLEVEWYQKTTPQTTRVSSEEGLVRVADCCNLLLTLRKNKGRRRLSPEARAIMKGVEARDLRSALGLVARAVLALTDTDYEVHAESHQHLAKPYSLFARMHAAFAAYGPAGEDSSQDAIDYTSVSVLIDLGFERGRHETAINRLRTQERPERLRKGKRPYRKSARK